jgi:hypothetical protein
MNAAAMKILCRNADLLSVEKQAVSRWICEEWFDNKGKAPKWLQHRYCNLFHFDLNSEDAPQMLARTLVLELLSKHKKLIAERRKT